MTSAVRTTLLLTVATCAPFFVVFAQEAAESVATSKILALENAWNRASETRDLRALDDLLDDAFVYVDRNGRLLTKSDVLKDGTESGVLRMETLSMWARPHGDTVIVTGLFRMKATLRGKLYTQQGRFVDTWAKKDGRWILLARLTTPTG